MIHKSHWFYRNILSLKPVVLEQKQHSDIKNIKVGIFYVDYINFINRKYKKIGNNSYACGLRNLHILKDLSEIHNIDLNLLISRDTTDVVTSYPFDLPIRYVKNYGTDVSTIAQSLDLIQNYDIVCICNSSAPTYSIKRFLNNAFSHMFKNLHHNSSFIIGVNANSRPSPSFKYFHRKSKHIITNCFITRSSDLIQILKAYETTNDYRIWGNKYFAIRNYELQLSNSVLHSNGFISYVNNTILSLPNDCKQWPKYDTRLIIKP